MQVPGVLDVLFLTSALLSALLPDLAPFAGLQETPKATVAVHVRGRHSIKFHCII